MVSPHQLITVCPKYLQLFLDKWWRKWQSLTLLKEIPGLPHEGMEAASGTLSQCHVQTSSLQPGTHSSTSAMGSPTREPQTRLEWEAAGVKWALVDQATEPATSERAEVLWVLEQAKKPGSSIRNTYGNIWVRAATWSHISRWETIDPERLARKLHKR